MHPLAQLSLPLARSKRFASLVEALDQLAMARLLESRIDGFIPSNLFTMNLRYASQLSWPRIFPFVSDFMHLDHSSLNARFLKQSFPTKRSILC